MTFKRHVWNFQNQNFNTPVPLIPLVSESCRMSALPFLEANFSPHDGDSRIATAFMRAILTVSPSS